MVTTRQFKQKNFRLSIIAISLMSSFPTISAAENNGPNKTSETKTIESLGLETVVVTAERRKENLQKTAISIAVVSSEAMKEQGNTTLDSFIRDIPAVSIQSSVSGAQVFVRGVGSNGAANWIDSSVALMLDNVYSGLTEQVYGGMYDIARVEVLRGPQGTLYGRNATGGVVNVLPNNPSNKFEGSINGQLGNYNLHRIDGAVNVPVNDALALRVAAVSDQRDGYFSNNGRASDFFGTRIKALVKPSSTLSILGTVDYSTEKGDGATTVAGKTNNAPPLFVVFSNPWTTDHTDPWQVDAQHPAVKRDLEFTTYSLQVDWNLGWSNLTYIPAATHSKRKTIGNLIDGSANGVVIFDPSTDIEDQYTHEIRLTSPSNSAIKWTTGLYTLVSSNLTVGWPGGASALDFEAYGVANSASSAAIFGQATYPITDSFRATLGARSTHDEKTTNWGIKSKLVSGPYDSGLLTASNKYSAVTYKAGLEYDLNSKVMFYGQVATGYKAGGFSTTAYPAVPYAPEKLKAFELGVKSRLLDNTLQLNAELYSYNYDGYQVQYAAFAAPSPNLGAGAAATTFQQYVVNAGRGENKGYEIESKYKLTPNDILSLSLSYTDAHYGDFSVADLQYLNGAQVATVSPKTFNLGYEHIFELESGASIAAKLQTKLSDGYRVTLESGLPGTDSSMYYQANYHHSDLSVTYRSADDDWTASAWVKNIENKAQITALMPWSRAQISDPRTFGVNLGYKF